MSASSSVTGGNTTIQRNLSNLEYYKQFPEIFNGSKFRVPKDVKTQLSAKERSILRKLNRSMELGEDLRITPRNVEVIFSLIEKIQRHYNTLELSDKEISDHIKAIQENIQKSSRENLKGHYFYHMRTAVREYAKMMRINLATLLKQAKSRDHISNDEFLHLVHNLVNLKKCCKECIILLIDGSILDDPEICDSLCQEQL
jgi:flagellar biosynthesis chaperone FliJ